MTLWYLARAAGVMALVFFTVSAVLGAVGAAGNNPGRRFWLQYVHRSAAVTGLVLIAAHVAAVVADSNVQIGLSVLVWPFGSGYRPLAMAVGVLALYGLVLAAVVGAMRGRMARSEGFTKWWRVVHLVAAAGWVLSVGHGLLAGTDAGAWWMFAVNVACVLTVAAAVAFRLRHRSAQTRTTFRTAPVLVQR